MGYGDLLRVKTSGASHDTAGAYREGLRGGVKASEEMASDDLERLKEYKTIIIKVAEKYAVDPAVIAGIISRESQAGHSISNTKPPGWGDNFKAFGLMQVDVSPNGGGHTPRGAWHSEEHLDQATEILVEFIERIQNKFPGWTREQQLKGGIAAYNMGDGNVHTYSKVDENTTGKDYSNDVVARAQWYQDNLFKVGFVEATKSFFWPF